MKFNWKIVLLILAALLLLCVLALAAILVVKSQLDITQLNQQVTDLKNQITPTSSDNTTPTDTVAPTTSGGVPTNNTVAVYFSKDPDSYSDSGTVVGVNRTNTGGSAYVFAMNQLLQGPTASEQSVSGLFVPFSLAGTSNCGGAGYTLQKTDNSIDLTFCKTVNEKFPAGGGTAGQSLQAEARVLQVINKTLKISGTEQISIRTSDGNCYGLDASGDGTLNFCTM